MKTTSDIATKLASETANTAVALATTASKTASDLAIKTAETTTAINTNIEWMKKSLTGIEEKLNEMDKAFVTAAQHALVLAAIEDHEKRLRYVETNLTRVLTWGSIALIGLGVIEFLLNFTNR